MARHADLTVTLPAGANTDPTRARLLAMGFTEQRLERRRAEPAVDVVEAPTIEREVDEIARRILEQAAAGRPFREMGVIVRSADVYEPILRATLQRYGIPARFYLDSELAAHGVARYLAGIVDALLGGWEPGATLAVLRLDPRLGNSQAMDEFAQTGQASWPALIELQTRLRALDPWRQAKLTPPEWAREARLPARVLRSACAPPSRRLARWRNCGARRPPCSPLRRSRRGGRRLVSRHARHPAGRILARGQGHPAALAAARGR